MSVSEIIKSYVCHLVQQRLKTFFINTAGTFSMRCIRSLFEKKNADKYYCFTVTINNSLSQSKWYGASLHLQVSQTSFYKKELSINWTRSYNWCKFIGIVIVCYFVILLFWYFLSTTVELFECSFPYYKSTAYDYANCSNCPLRSHNRSHSDYNNKYYLYSKQR